MSDKYFRKKSTLFKIEHCCGFREFCYNVQSGPELVILLPQAYITQTRRDSNFIFLIKLGDLLEQARRLT